MAKLLISLDGVPVGERDIDKERISIGRRAHNDIVLDNIGVSGEHAVLVTILNDSFIEDLESTNGTQVNGTATRKHFLRNGDQIEIGNHRLQFIGAVAAMCEAADFEKTMVLNRPSAAARAPALGDVRSATVASGWTAAAGEDADVALMTRPPATVAARSPTAAPPPAAYAAFTVPSSAAGFPQLPTDAIADLDAHAASQAAAEGDADATAGAPKPAADPVADAAHSADPGHAAETASAAGSALASGTAPAAEAVHPDRVAPIVDAGHAGAAVPVAAAPSSAGLAAFGEAAPATMPMPAGPASGARLQVLNGSAAGRILEISKPLTTVGRPGIQVVVLSRRSDGYYLAQVDGDQAARLNGAALVPHAVALHAHDVMEVAGVKLEFFYQA